MMTLSATPHSQPNAPTARPPLANQPQVSGCLQPAHQSIWFGVAAGLSTTSYFISTCTGLQGFNHYNYCTYNPLKYTDPSGYRRKPDGWDQPWVALNGGIWSGGRMGPGSGKHWSDAFRGEWGNFMLGNQGAYDGMYGLGADNNFVNNVYPKEKKQTSHDDRLLMHFVGFKWNPVGGVEVERGGDDGDLRIYCSGSWQKKDGGRGKDDGEGEGCESNYWLAKAGAFAITTSVADGPLFIGEAIGATVFIVAAVHDATVATKNYLNKLGVQCSLRTASGDIWKIGQTTQYDFSTGKQWRYTQSQLNSWGVTFLPEFSGNRVEILMV